ncbi:hypothetical protein BDW22DRAFT_1100130 [Trametopsis cervina]|nr:hypothetical protein BDW22DRAFT_1100130 [Trametopsis cervina]
MGQGIICRVERHLSVRCRSRLLVACIASMMSLLGSSTLVCYRHVLRTNIIHPRSIGIHAAEALRRTHHVHLYAYTTVSLFALTHDALDFSSVLEPAFKILKDCPIFKIACITFARRLRPRTFTNSPSHSLRCLDARHRKLQSSPRCHTLCTRVYARARLA